MKKLLKQVRGQKQVREWKQVKDGEIAVRIGIANSLELIFIQHIMNL